MKTKSESKVLAGGSVLKETTFEFRPLDKYGDCIDPEACASLDEARKLAASAIGSYDGECVAWVIERHTAYYPARFGDEKYETIEKGGDANALEEGGWND